LIPITLCLLFNNVIHHLIIHTSSLKGAEKKTDTPAVMSQDLIMIEEKETEEDQQDVARAITTVNQIVTDQTSPAIEVIRMLVDIKEMDKDLTVQILTTERRLR